MSLSGAIETCKRKSRAICHCWNNNICLDHLKERVDLINSQMNPLADEINTLDNQLSLLNVDEIIDKYRQKLDKWRHECHATVDRFYEEKCQELQQRYVEKVVEKRKKLHQLKLKINELIREQEARHDDISSLKATINGIERDVNQYEENGIVVDVNPLIINQNLVYIEQWASNELTISTLSSPYRTVACSKDNWSAMTSNNHFLLVDQYPNLCLYDEQLTHVKEYPWEFISNDKCTSCNYDELINNIAYDNETLALIIENRTNNKNRIEFRSSSTFDPLWSTTFNAAYCFAPWKNRVCVLKHNEWLVIDHKNSHLLHVSKDGQVKAKRSYKPTFNNAVVLGTNILAIKTADNINCYRI
ncbi:unnamed protein product [Rotaria socialis]|uniref:Uncharacterized protein n=1 Tax=Rotaria socialis TaxID=392032 RepID=A0A818KPJ0_9BILA|nr:unnamed protein product [Rotaria socialis]CAF4627005.1 unnamed protein product [Rotaria socialis]